MTKGARQRLSRRAKLQGVDYAVLASGQQIPEYSSSSESSGDDASYGGSSKRRRRKKQHATSSSDSENMATLIQTDDITRTITTATATASKRSRKTTAPGDCFICARASRSPFMQCEICARWYHYRCWKPFESASVLGNTSCHECVQGRTTTLQRTLHTSTSVTSTLSCLKPPVATLDDFLNLLRTAKKILVVAGAGMSVSCGIPDFRSKDGIYAILQSMETHLPEPECVFQIEYFRQDPTPFFALARRVFADDPPAPSPTHRFLRLLEDKHKLLRLYSQNIDGLEAVAGVTRYIPCHGSFATSKCMRCKHVIATRGAVLAAIHAGVIPTCGERHCSGVLKPEITFFGELLSDKVSTSVTRDRLDADLLLVIGTSLKVSPIAEIPGFLPPHVPQVVINKTLLKKKALKRKTNRQVDARDEEDAAAARAFDLTLLGDCDAIIQYICDAMQWTLPSVVGGGDSATIQAPVRQQRQQQHLRVIHHVDKPNVVCFGECHCANTLDKRHDDKSDQDDDATPSGFVWCVSDGCSKDFSAAHATNQRHYACNECFDYDLCGPCYLTPAKVRLSHFEGAHTFSQV